MVSDFVEVSSLTTELAKCRAESVVPKLTRRGRFELDASLLCSKVNSAVRLRLLDATAFGACVRGRTTGLAEVLATGAVGEEGMVMGLDCAPVPEVRLL